MTVSCLPIPKTLILAAILVVCVGVFSSHAVVFSFENQSDTTIIYNLWWYDHKIDDFPRPARFAAGELRPNVIHNLETDYKGEYFIVSIDGGNMLIANLTELKIKKDTAHMHLIWDGSTLKEKK
jgi:hypothetical protein